MNERIQPYFDYPKCRIIFDGRPLGNYPRITDSDSAMPILADLFGECCNHHEECYALFLSRANDLLGVMRLSMGGGNNTVVDIKIMAQGAVLCNASGMIMAHNHPSGDPKPGKTDIQLTAEVTKAMQLLEINMLDHIVVADGRYYTFADDEVRTFSMPKPATLSDRTWGYGKGTQQELF